ncbi:MAG: class I SAM-dependent methyltransferase [Rickettsiaceae bacterium]
MSKSKTEKTHSKGKDSEKYPGLVDLPKVREHYQDYPYPGRNPEDEKKRLLQLGGEYIGELNHWLYNGKEDFQSNFRLLVAAGGTGDAIIYFAEQLKNTNAELVYLDFSKASIEIAKKRAEVRGLKNIKWVFDSILNIPKLKLGKFNYINCSGVLHHLSSPDGGIKILQESLTDNGALNAMVYGQYGRTGVYQVQELMRVVNSDIDDDRALEVENAKIILQSLPKTNWYSRGAELISDVQNYGDIGIYDLLLHKQDRAYTIPQLYEFIENAGLSFVQFSDISERSALKVERYIKNSYLLEKIKKTSKRNQQAIAELIFGSVIKHTFYSTNSKSNTVAELDDLDNTPYTFMSQNIPSNIINAISANPAMINTTVNMTINHAFCNQVIGLPIDNYTAHIFKYIDKELSLSEIFDNIRTDLKQEIPNETLIKSVKLSLDPLIDCGCILLKNKSVKFK